jgi:mono/diheme cytochrome c family protein
MPLRAQKREKTKDMPVTQVPPFRPVGLLGAGLLALGLSLGGCSANKFSEPMKLGGQTVSAETLNRGYEAYNLYCVYCHGEKGDGRGPSGIALRPPPRDFTQGLFKFGGVQIPMLPPDSELRRIIRSGLHGTAMWPWDLTETELADVTQYIKTFAPHRWIQEEAGKPIEISADPFGAAKKDEAVTLGKKLYHAKAQCSGCHPSFVTHEELFNITKELSGEGQREFSAEMYYSQIKDSEYCLEWKAGWTKLEDRECVKPVKVMPPDFTRDPLRNVRIARNQPPNRPAEEQVTDETTTKDLYRTIASGIGGANMPTWKGALSEQELWGLAYYVKSLVALNDPENPEVVKQANALHGRLMDKANLSWTPPPAAPPPPAPAVVPAGGAAKPPKK